MFIMSQTSTETPFWDTNTATMISTDTDGEGIGSIGRFGWIGGLEGREFSKAMGFE
jgi:hypothetical protein